MAVVVRLRRMGNRNNPFYRVVAADNRTPTDGKFIERLGWYNPNLGGVNFKLDMERVQYWQENGAQFTGTVKSLVKQAKNLPADAVPSTQPPEQVASTPAPEPVVEATPAAEEIVEAPAAAEEAAPAAEDESAKTEA